MADASVIKPETATSEAEGGPAKEKASKAKRKPRSPLAKLFLIKPWGYVKLFAYCVLVGFVMLAIRFNPADPGFDAGMAVHDLWSNTISAARWALLHLWEPALAGATIVLPLWVIWRLVTLPFRK